MNLKLDLLPNKLHNLIFKFNQALESDIIPLSPKLIYGSTKC